MISVFKTTSDVKEAVENLRGGKDRLEILINIHKSLSVSTSINEAMINILSMESSIVLITEELIKLLNISIDNTMKYIDVVDEITGIMDDRGKKPLFDIKEKTMAV